MSTILRSDTRDPTYGKTSAEPSDEVASPSGHVLFVLDHFYPHVGGGETLFFELTRALAARGWQVTVVTLRSPGMPREERLDGVRVVRVSTPPFARRYWFIVAAILPALRLSIGANLVHAGGYAAAWAAWFAGWWGRLPKVLTVYEVFADQWLTLGDVPWLLGWSFRLYEWLSLRLPFDRYLCISAFTRDRLLRFARVPEMRTRVVYSALDYEFWDARQHASRDLKAELGLNPSTFVYTCFGRPGVSKGVDYLVKAAALLRDKQPDSHLLLLLSRDPSDGYRRVLQTISGLDLNQHVTVKDPVPRAELPSYLLGSDCVVVPSLSEGFGYSAVEAATLGCPVIATRGHAVEEVLGDYGVFVPPRDAQALADALLASATNHVKSSPMPPRYTSDRHVTEIVRIYQGLIPLGLAEPAVESSKSATNP